MLRGELKLPETEEPTLSGLRGSGKGHVAPSLPEEREKVVVGRCLTALGMFILVSPMEL